MIQKFIDKFQRILGHWSNGAMLAAVGMMLPKLIDLTKIGPNKTKKCVGDPVVSRKNIWGLNLIFPKLQCKINTIC